MSIDLIGRHLGFKTRTVNALLRGATWSGDSLVEGVGSITTIERLAGSTARDVLRLRGAGKHTLADCERVLRAHRYSAANSQLLKEIESLRCHS